MSPPDEYRRKKFAVVVKDTPLSDEDIDAILEVTYNGFQNYRLGFTKREVELVIAALQQWLKEKS